MTRMKRQPSSGFGKFVAVIFGSGVVFVLIAGVYFLLKSKEADKYRLVIKNPLAAMGVVIEKRAYKGKGMDVYYSVDGRTYEYKTSINGQVYNRYQVGDTISLTVCKNDPSFALLTLEINRAKLERFLGKEADTYMDIWRSKSPKQPTSK